MVTGNHEFDEIYYKYRNLVLKTAYLYSGSYDASEDITQETFFKLYKAYDSMRKDNIPAWLITITKNAALNYSKKANRETILNTDEEESEIESELIRESTEIEYFEEWKEKERARLHKEIFDGLQKKNTRWYECIMYVCYMEMPQAKAAEIMGIRTEVLHSMLHRARKWIKKKYGAEYEEINREV